MADQMTINATISDEFRKTLITIVENITEFHTTIPKQIMQAYKQYANYGDIAALEKVRGYLADQTGLPELTKPLIADQDEYGCKENTKRIDIMQRMEKQRKEFSSSHSYTAMQAYEMKVQDLSNRLENNIAHAAEIIADEIKECDIMRWKAKLTNNQDIIDEWVGTDHAIEDVSSLLCELRPL